MELTGRVAGELAAALRGERDPMQLLFPGGSLETAERLYRDAPTARYFNGLMAHVAATAADRFAAPERRMRILEVGGGTGGSTNACPLDLVGFATREGGTTGGGNAASTTVTTQAELRACATASGARVCRVQGTLTFSPFVADLHHRGERDRLDGLYKQVTRWTLAATIPVLLVLLVLPAQVLRIFGEEFVSGASALRIVSLGMIVPVMVGTVGFILIMAGRTGWDLIVYAGSFAIDIALARAGNRR